MRRKRIAVIASLVAAACAGSASGLPSVTPVSPDDARHVAPSYSPDGGGSRTHDLRIKSLRTLVSRSTSQTT
jgi:hypothetical protein